MKEPVAGPWSLYTYRRTARYVRDGRNRAGRLTNIYPGNSLESGQHEAGGWRRPPQPAGLASLFVKRMPGTGKIPDPSVKSSGMGAFGHAHPVQTPGSNMYGIIFNCFQPRPEPSKQLPGFVYKDQGRTGGRGNGVCARVVIPRMGRTHKEQWPAGTAGPASMPPALQP